MSITLIDRVSAIVFQNGLLRIECISIGPNNEERNSGTLIIPGTQVANFIKSLAMGTQELDKRLREAAEQHAEAAKFGAAGNA